MIYLEKYTGDKTYVYPNRQIASPERVKADYPAVSVFAYVVKTDEAKQVMLGLENLSALRMNYSIDASLTEEEAIEAIEELMNAPEEEAEPSAEERIAAALEFQNIMTMSDEV